MRGREEGGIAAHMYVKGPGDGRLRVGFVVLSKTPDFRYDLDNTLSWERYALLSLISPMQFSQFPILRPGERGSCGMEHLHVLEEQLGVVAV
jgi:hypothetical protein